MHKHPRVLFPLYPPYLLGWDSLPSPGSLAHLATTHASTSAVAGQALTTVLAAASATNPSVTTTIPRLVICDTGEPLSERLVKLIRTLDFVELHEFLPAPLLRAAVADTATDCKCCVAKDKEKRSPKTVADIYTWLLCFHRFTAAASSIHPGKVGQFLAYANTVLQAYIQFEGDGWRAYDRAFRLKVAGRPLVDWATLDLPLYARIFTAQVRRGNSCRDCGGLDHPTTACPWGVDVHLPVPPGTSTPPMGAPYTGTSPPLRPRPPPAQMICSSWNYGACRFPGTCNFQHVCSHCFSMDHRAMACPIRPRRRAQWTDPAPGPQRFRPEQLPGYRPRPPLPKGGYGPGYPPPR